MHQNLILKILTAELESKMLKILISKTTEIAKREAEEIIGLDSLEVGMQRMIMRIRSKLKILEEPMMECKQI